MIGREANELMHEVEAKVVEPLEATLVRRHDAGKDIVSKEDDIVNLEVGFLFQHSSSIEL